MGEVVTVPIEEELKRAYLDYAMSVIVGRALPDVRDGLKPVQRRILYTMYELKNDWNKPYKKSARIVGDVMGKYHPHGDMAIYDTLVRMAQDFTMRYPLVDGQGNFGSIDGDAPAAMRYTEVRLSKIAHELMADIDKETVDFVPNYDNTLQEPSVLPSKIPNLLINGSSGIAVGMATNIPPHNLGEIIDALVAMIRDPDITIDELLQYIKGPDFPTGAFICGTAGIKEAYATGKGLIKLRAKAHIEKQGANKRSIVITELPYQVNKAKLVEKIAMLARDKKIEGIAEVRDESDREGLRVVVELKREKQDFAPVILNQLYKHTPMESSYGIIMLALVNNRPEQLNLYELLRHFLDHRRTVVTRRTLYDLRKARERAHILEGLMIALAHLDEVIALIKSSKTPSEAKERLIGRFNLTPIQAQAILDMRLQRLTNLEQEKIRAEYEELKRQIAWYEKILSDEKVLLKVIEEELLKIKELYADPRRTEIITNTEDLTVEDLIAEEEMVVTLTLRGYIKRLPASTYRSQHRGGRGKRGIETGEQDIVTQLYVASTHEQFLCFTNLGKVYWLKVYDIPQAGRTARGTALRNLLPLADNETVATILPVKEFDDRLCVFFVTREGLVKKTPLSAFSHPRSTGIVAIQLKGGDQLVGAALTDGRRHVLLVTYKGQCIRFAEEEVRAMGRMAAGVKGIDLMEGDFVVGVEIFEPEEDSSILTVAELGYGKRTLLGEFRQQKRGGKGIMAMKLNRRTGNLVGCLRVNDEDEVMLLSSSGQIIRLRVRDIPIQGRVTQGVKLFMISPGEKIVSLARLAEKD